MAYTDIDDSSAYFQTKIYTGTGSTHNVTLDGNSNLQPDWVWIKDRQNGGYNHNSYDSVRGATKLIWPNLTNTEGTYSNSLTSFNSNGFTLGSDSSNGEVNRSNVNYVSWNWKAGGSASTNTTGSINSSVSVNTTAGISILTFTGSGSGVAENVGHGLGVTPKLMIGKNLDSSHSVFGSWMVGGLGVSSSFNFSTNYINLNSGAGLSSDAGGTVWNAAPTSTLVKFSNFFNTASNDYVMYCFAEKKGFSKFGTYTGNGSSNGAFVYTGFKPAVWIVKRTNATNNWITFDNKRSTSQGFNRNNVLLLPNLNQGENTNDGVVDFVSNGIKIRDTKDEFNNSSGTYMYMAFAENPFVTSTGIPTPAR